MSKISVFISYAREDSAFVESLRKGLQQCGIECLGDWKLTPGDNYEKELKQFNLAASFFIFIISPDSVASDACKNEVLFASENSKFILPVAYKDHGNDNSLPLAVRTQQWIYAHDPKKIEETIRLILEASRTDFDLMGTHAGLLMDVEEWANKNKNSSYLLKKDKLKEAEEWLKKVSVQPDKLPQPTKEQVEYIIESQRDATRSNRRNSIIAGIIIVLLAGLSVYAFYQSNEAEKNAKEAKANADTATKNKNIAEANEQQALNNLKQFKVEEFKRNVRNGKIYIEAEEYQFARQALDSAESTARLPFYDTVFEIRKEKDTVFKLLGICKAKLNKTK